MKQIRWIWHFWQPHLAWLWILALLTLLSSAVSIGYPQVFRYVIDTINAALAAKDPQLAGQVAWRSISVLAVIGLARSLTQLYPGVRALINSKLELSIRQHYFSAIIDKGYLFFSRLRTGDLVTRLTDDISGFPKIAWFCCSGIFRAVESGSKLLFLLAVMLWMNWELALLAVAPLPVMMFIFYRVKAALAERSATRQRVLSKTSDALESAFSGIRIIKAFNAEEGQSRQFDRILEERIDAETNVTKLWLGVQSLYTVIQFVGQTIVIVAGGLMVIRGTLTVGEFYAFYVYLSMMLDPLRDIPQLFVTSRQAFVCIDREIEIEETPGGTEGRREPPACGHFAALSGVESLELSNVSFRYREDLPLVLDGVSLSLKAGERIAIMGAVGSGKSTLLKVLAGILPPERGGVEVNGQPLRSFDLQAYRALSGYVPQEATLFSETVAENVSFGRNLPEERVKASLSAARVLDEIEQMPGGTGVKLGQRGLTVSGGQKQRIAIARAVAASPGLLLLDDCTSALDASNEEAMWQSISGGLDSADASLPAAPIIVVVTHRLATARQADRIYMLENGSIVGAGTHDELLRTCEQYQGFHRKEELAAALRD